MSEPAPPAPDAAARPLFLLSLPRSGSTLLQRLLAGHPDVATTAEPWLLLPLLYALRTEGVYAEYGHRSAARALQDLCEHLPEGQDTYRREVAALARRLYAQARPGDEAWFLDKTPRYALIVDELLDLFPDARFVVLWRDPLGVLASLSQTWADGRWQPHHHKVDLYAALDLLTAAVARHPDRFVTVRFEDLVASPEEELRRLLPHLELDWDPHMLDGLGDRRLEGRLGDPTGVDRYRSVSTAPVDAWREVLRSPVRKAWARRYLTWVGHERLALMGYDLAERLAALRDNPGSPRRLPDDLWLAAKGLVYDLTEPQIAKPKLRRARRWRQVVTHT